MKPILIAALLAFPSYGIVESVREVELAAASPFGGVVEQVFKPHTGDELRVRLEDGSAVTVLYGGMNLFVPGQRVLVVPERSGLTVVLSQPAT